MATTGHENESINVSGLKASLQSLKSTYIDNTVWTTSQSLSVVQKDQAVSNILDKTDTSGMKRVVLKKSDNFKTKVEGQTGGNVIFVIQYDYTLSGNTTIPSNCILDFQGGSLSGTYTITGNNTSIQASLVKIFNTNVTLAGTWNVSEAYPEWFGAKGDGSNNDSTSIEKIIGSPFKKIVFNGKTYKLGSAILISRSNIIIHGSDTTIDCTSSGSGGILIVGSNSGFAIDGENVIIEGITFLGVTVDPSTRDSEYGRLIAVSENSNNIIIRGCTFKKGNGGAIYIYAGTGHEILNNKFLECNNHCGGGEYGSVHFSGGSNLIIKDNIFKNFSHSGISISGANNINVFDNSFYGIIENGMSMGIFVLDHGCENLTIYNNIFENVSAEHLSLHCYGGDSEAPLKNIVINNNIFKNAGYRQISFESHNNGRAIDCIIQNNTLIQTTQTGHGIAIDHGDNCVISDNKIENKQNNSNCIYVVKGSTGNNVIQNNYVKYGSVGIYVSDDARGSVKNNYILSCNYGITSSYSSGGLIIRDNVMVDIKTSIFEFSNASPILIGNHAHGASLGVGSNISINSQLTTNPYNVGYVTTGTLTNGASGSIAFHGLESGDILDVYPLSSGDGILSINAISYQWNTVSVISTKSNDNRDFIVIKRANYNGKTS